LSYTHAHTIKKKKKKRGELGTPWAGTGKKGGKKTSRANIVGSLYIGGGQIEHDQQGRDYLTVGGRERTPMLIVVI